MTDVTKQKTLQEHLKKSADKDLYAHVRKVMSHIVKHCPHKGVDDLEEISYLIKNHGTGKKLNKDEFFKTSIVNAYAMPADESCAQSTAKVIDTTQSMFKKAEVKLDEEGKEVEEPLPPVGNMPDIAKEAKVWEWAGISFGEYDLMLLIKSIKKLAKDSQAAQLRLWGKIRGSQKDYYIVEGTLGGGEEGEGGGDAGVEGMEARGTGVNKFSYWVTNSPIDPWVMLPDLKPQDIINARTIKYTISGNPDAKIYTNPFYFETEKTYLRAQIARITQSTTLVPKGLYKFQEETEEREIVENVPEDAEGGEIPKPPTEAMCNMDMWLHYVPSILKQGRLTHMDAKPAEGEEEGGEPEDAKKKEIAKDPWEPRLKPISMDDAIKGGLPPWIIRKYSCGHKSMDEKTQKFNKNYGVVMVKSMWWPGSYTFYSQEKTLQIYVGDGMKHESQSYFPVHPPMMQQDKKEVPCAEEPNPTQEWLDKKAALEEKAKQAQQPAENE